MTSLYGGSSFSAGLKFTSADIRKGSQIDTIDHTGVEEPESNDNIRKPTGDLTNGVCWSPDTQEGEFLFVSPKLGLRQKIKRIQDFAYHTILEDGMGSFEQKLELLQQQRVSLSAYWHTVYHLFHLFREGEVFSHYFSVFEEKTVRSVLGKKKETTTSQGASSVQEEGSAPPATAEETATKKKPYGGGFNTFFQLELYLVSKNPVDEAEEVYLREKADLWQEVKTQFPIDTAYYDLKDFVVDMEKIKAEFCVFLSQVALRVLANTTVPATTEEGEDQLSGLLEELERWKGSVTPFWESTADLREKIVSFVDN